MIEILESRLPDNKSVFISLTRIYGLNKNRTNKACKKLGFLQNFKTKKLNNLQILKIVNYFERQPYLLIRDLKKQKDAAKRVLVKNKVYRGLRVENGLPARGQRTHTNARTIKKLSRNKNKKIEKNNIKKKRQRRN